MSTIYLNERKFNCKNNENLFDCRKTMIIIGIIINTIFILSCFIKQINDKDIKNKEKILKYRERNINSKFHFNKIQTFLKNVKKENYDYYSSNEYEEILLKYEMNMPHLEDVNRKRTFNNRLPLPKKIDCKPHFFSLEELIAFMSFLTKDTIFFETGSGCSSIIANYYAKKVISIEGSKIWYEKGIKKGLNNSLIFKDLKSDDNNWSVPGKNSKIEDWKNYFQSYQKEYNADVIFIDGRFKIATAMDVFNKIKDDTIILIHEYKSRPSYFILEEYYNYVYHWNTLFALTKKKEVKEIPLEIQKKYWDEFI